MRVALVLSGGGARGAYEAGVVSVILPELERRGEAPSLFIGTSVGAINAASLAAVWHRGAEEAVAATLGHWRDVEKDRVIKPIFARQVPLTALRYAGEILSLPGVRVPSLLDPEPLGESLDGWIDWPMLHNNARDGAVAAVAAVATAARSGRTVVFVEGELGARVPHSHAVEYVAAELGAEHVRASAAIPIFFPPVRVESPRDVCGWYVDGGTRLNTPIKPALDLGADRIVVVGMDAVTEPPEEPGRHDSEPPDFGDGALHVLQGTLVDPLIEDVRLLGNVNAFFAADNEAGNRYRAARGKPPYRRVPYIFVAPTRHGAIGDLASEVFRARYGGLKGLRGTDFRLLSRLLGGESPTHGELLSYLFFDREFISELIAMGQRDARRWLHAPPGPGDPWQLEVLDTFVNPT